MNAPSRRRLAWLRDYSRADAPKDFLAALVVTLVLIPSAIAYADLAKCPPGAGLYAALAGMAAFALFTSSRRIVTGPDAAVALMVGATVASLTDGDPTRALAIATWLSLLTGALLLLAAWLKLGAAADFLAAPVMLGFMNGAALVIVISQLGKLTGVTLHEENSLLKVREWVHLLGNLHRPTLLAGLAGLGLLLVLRIALPRVPGAIVLFATALVAGLVVDCPVHGLAVIGAVDTRIPDPVPPELSLTDVATLVISALGLAFLIFPEGIVLGRSMAERHGETIDADRELVALGVANLAAGLVRGFPVGASQSRSLLADAAGGRTPMVSLLASGLLVAFLVFFAEGIARLPTVAIAAILVFTGITLIDLAGIRKLRSHRRIDALISLVTTAGVVALGVLPGILLGVFLSLARLLLQLARPHDALLGRIEGSPAFHDVGDDEQARTLPGLVIYRFYGPLIFANVRYFTERLEHFLSLERQPVQGVILDARAIPEIDVTAAEELNRFIAKLRSRGIRFAIAKAHLPLREASAALGLQEWFSVARHYDHLEDCVSEFQKTEDVSADRSRR